MTRLDLDDEQQDQARFQDGVIKTTKTIKTSEDLTFFRACDPTPGRFQISPAAFATMCRYIQDRLTKTEAGGVLLGRHILGTGDIVVDRVTHPMTGDRRGRYFFRRARKRHQKAIDRAWAESEGTCTYLGEWHTHPEAFPTPSPTDRFTWWRKLRSDHFSEPIFFLIVGTEAVRAWEGQRGRRPMLLARKTKTMPERAERAERADKGHQTTGQEGVEAGEGRKEGNELDC